MSSQQQNNRLFSFEFFPPRTPEATARLGVTQMRLAKLKPDFFSVTFGAGGNTRENTLETALQIRNNTHIKTVPHISCMGHQASELQEILKQYKAQDIHHLVVLRGDLPSGVGSYGDFRYASELVAFIRKLYGDYFHIDVAAYPETHPQAANAALDLQHFKDKVTAGANSALTQYFYNADAYFRFIDDCAAIGIDVPIVPGIMPITNFTQLSRFSESCGAEIPRWIVKKLQQFGDDRKSICAFGIEVVTNLCERLLENQAPGLHFYSMNMADSPVAIWNNLGLTESNS